MAIANEETNYTFLDIKRMEDNINNKNNHNNNNLHHHYHFPKYFCNSKHHRAKKATLQLVVEQDLFDEKNHAETHDPKNNHSTSSATAPTSEMGLMRFKSIVERIVSTPLVAYFTCNTNDHDDDDDDDDITEKNQSHILFRLFRNTSERTGYIQERAPRAVVHTMKQFPYQGRIQRLGCAALRDMAMDSWQGKTLVVQAGSVETILKAMRIHSKDSKLQEIACKCLYPLVAGDLPKLLVEKGVVGAMLTTMEMHEHDEDVIPLACDVLLALTDQNDEGVECLRRRLGGVILAKVEYSFRGQNDDISQKAGELLRRLYSARQS